MKITLYVDCSHGKNSIHVIYNEKGARVGHCGGGQTFSIDPFQELSFSMDAVRIEGDIGFAIPRDLFRIYEK